MPGTRWLIASGMKAGGGLQFIDTRAKSARPAWRTGTAAAQADKTRYASCPGPVDPKQPIFHGLAVRPATGGSFTVYATNHGGRETVEVFRLDGAAATPSLTWVGCIPMPDKLQANSVAAFPDGSLLATVVMLPGFGFGDMFAGKNTGAIFSWAPGQAAFTRLAGTDLPGPNGVDTSADGREFYVALSGVRRIVAFTRTLVKLVRTAQLSGFVPDNVRLVSGRLFTAGMVDDEKACGGAPKEPKDIQCPRGHIAVSLDPATLSQTEIARGLVAPPYTGTAIAIPMGNELWLSSLNSDRIAWRPLK